MRKAEMPQCQLQVTRSNIILLQEFAVCQRYSLAHKTLKICDKTFACELVCSG